MGTQPIMLVKPAEPTPEHVLPLSTLDSQLFLRFTIEYLLVFRPCRKASRSDVASSLRFALSRILVPYYPLAGRVRVKSDGCGLEVDCKSQGAVFVQATSDNFTVQDFHRAPRRVAQWRPFLSFSVEDVLSGAPPVVLQLTWLKDGGAVLGIGMNHCLCDGIGSGEFLNSFAEFARSRYSVAVLKPIPVWDRHFLDPPPLRLPTAAHCHAEFTCVSDVAGTFGARFSDEKLVPTSAVFTSAIITDLKYQARLSAPNGNSSYTSFEVLAAHVWKSWASSLNFPPNQELKLLFSIDVRNRVSPPLAKGFYGNAFILGCAQTTAKELTTKGIGYGSRLIRQAKDQADDDHVRSLIELLSSRRQSCPDSTGVLVMSQWSRLGLENVDFGMGTAVHVTPVCCDRYCLILPAGEGCSPGEVRVMVAVPASGAAKYECLLQTTVNNFIV